MIIGNLLAAMLAVIALNPAPPAGQDAPATLVAQHQPASVQSGITDIRHMSGPVAATATYPSRALYPSSVPPRPHYVAGYTNHALERMAERGISKAEVEALVASPDPGYYQDDNDTWLINNGRLIVIINKNAWIVTGIKGQM